MRHLNGSVIHEPSTQSVLLCRHQTSVLLPCKNTFERVVKVSERLDHVPHRGMKSCFLGVLIFLNFALNHLNMLNISQHIFLLM